MSRGMHIAVCHACGCQYIVGDCITSTCPECKAKGHSDSMWCEACIEEKEQLDKKIKKINKK